MHMLAANGAISSWVLQSGPWTQYRQSQASRPFLFFNFKDANVVVRKLCIDAMDSTGSPQAVPAQEDLTAYAPASPTLDKTPIPTITEDDDDESEASSDCSSVQNGISIQMTPTKALPTIEEAFNSLSCRAICTFGFGSSCFYYAGDRCNSWKYLADKKNPLLGITATAVKRMNMSTPHCVALSTLGAGYFAYTSPSAGVCWRFFSMPQEMRPKTLGGRKGRKRFDDVQMAHKQLKKWLQENIVTENDIRTAKVVFGAGASFMAWKMDSNEWISNELPSSLTSELEQRRMHSKGAKEMPKLVTLGAGKSWAAVWSDGTHSIDLDNKYPTLSHSLKGIVSYKILVMKSASYHQNNGPQVMLTPSHLVYRSLPHQGRLPLLHPPLSFEAISTDSLGAANSDRPQRLGVPDACVVAGDCQQDMPNIDTRW